MQAIPTDISINELLTELSPKLAKEGIESAGRVDELAGTEFTLLVDIEGESTYSYVVKDGINFDVKTEAIADPLVAISLTKDDMEKMIATGNLDMLLGIQQDLTIAKYNALKGMKGCFKAELKNEDGSFFSIKTICNGIDTPTCTFKMTTADSAKVAKKEAHPVNMFMSGQMQIEGDMAFAMATQPLFT